MTLYFLAPTNEWKKFVCNCFRPSRPDAPHLRLTLDDQCQSNNSKWKYKYMLKVEKDPVDPEGPCCSHDFVESEDNGDDVFPNMKMAEEEIEDEKMDDGRDDEHYDSDYSDEL
jgi:hypothetical protein